MVQIDYKLKAKSGIYSILNTVNGKRYIGSSINIYNRFHEHLHNLNGNNAHNKHLQAAWNKYGEENFIFNVLELCDPNIRFKREQYYLDMLNPEYNFSSLVLANSGRDLTEEQKLKISNTLKEKYANGELTPYINKSTFKECWIYDIINWKFCKYCKNFLEASKFLSVNRDTISSGKIKSRIYCNKFIISLHEFKTIASLKNFVYRDFYKAKTKNTNYIIAEDDSENLYYFRSYASCGKFVGNSAECLRLHVSCTKESPYITKYGFKFYTSLEYIPLMETAVPIEKSSELLSGNIGGSPTVEDNAEINSETKKSESSYSVEDETI